MSNVYIGFMDEEVRPILAQLLKKKGSAEKSNNVLIIERGNIDPDGVLFERPISAYDCPVLWRGWCGVSPKGENAGKMTFEPDTINNKTMNPNRQTWLNVFQQCMYINMSEIYSKLPNRILTQEKGRSVKYKLGLLPSVSMLYMGEHPGRSGALPTRILIRSPEMGLQPGLIRTQLRAILKALKSASNATPDDPVKVQTNKLNIWCYGAGGAYCGSELSGGPGAVWDIKGSIYIGVERDKSAEKNREENTGVNLYQGEISYCSDKDQQTLYRTPGFYTVAEARKNIESCFSSNSANQESLLYRQLGAVALNNPTSITSNSFIGGGIKSSARAYGLKGEVNMEDYHLYRLIQSLKSSQENYTSVRNIEAKYPFIANAKVIRIDADPAEIPETTVEALQGLNPKSCTLENYANVISWGLMGLQSGENNADIPDALNWAVNEGFKASIGPFLVAYKGSNGDSKYINPFLLESAQDLFREVSDWLDRVKINDNEINNNPFNVHGLVKGVKSKALETTHRELSDALKNYCQGRENEIKSDLCKPFLTALYAFFNLTIVKNLEENSNQDLYPIWARGGWGAEKNKAYVVENMKYDGSNVDRAFYKSTNMTVLNKNASDAVNNHFVAG